MPGAGTDKTKRWLETPAPIVVLVEPQLGENIGAAARAMANFGLSRLRLVKPLQGWPNEKARAMAAGADRVLDAAVLYDSLGDASPIAASCSRRPRAITTRPSSWSAPMRRRPRWRRASRPAKLSRSCSGASVIGLENHEVALADRIVTLPVNPAFASLNLAQAVVIVGYEWLKRKAAANYRSPCRRNRRRSPSSNSMPSLPTWSANWKKSSFSARRKSAAP